MKRGTPEHPKMLDLAEIIQVYLESQHGLNLPFELAHDLTCGMIEKMWHYAARYSPDGGIGKHSNVRIARAIGWPYDAHWIVESLQKSGFLDDCESCRLFIHDWHQHSDQAADKWLRDKNLDYANGFPPRLRPEREKARSRKVSTSFDKFRPSRNKFLQSEPEPEPKPEPEPEPKPEPEPESSSESKPKPEPKANPELAGNGSGVFQTEISEEMLRDTGKLFAWLISESLKPNPIIRDSEQNRNFVLAIAERALSIGKKNKCGLFFSLIRDDKREFATGEWEDRAKSRLDEYRRKSRRSPAGAVPTPMLRRAT